MFHYSPEPSKTDNHRYPHCSRPRPPLIEPHEDGVEDNAQHVSQSISCSYKCHVRPPLLFLSFPGKDIRIQMHSFAVINVAVTKTYSYTTGVIIKAVMVAVTWWWRGCLLLSDVFRVLYYFCPDLIARLSWIFMGYREAINIRFGRNFVNFIGSWVRYVDNGQYK